MQIYNFSPTFLSEPLFSDKKKPMGVIKKSLKRQWSFSNLVSFCRIHLFNYIHLTKFLESPEKDWELDSKSDGQLGLFDDYLATG